MFDSIPSHSFPTRPSARPADERRRRGRSVLSGSVVSARVAGEHPAHRLLALAWSLALLALVLSALLAPPTASAQEVVQRGSWTAKGFDIDGTWSIVREGGKLVLVLDDGFATKSAPDLKIFLSPKALAQLENRNAIDGAVLVARLESNRGSQRYDLPGDLSGYRAVIIHCEKYSKLWGGADLR